MESVRSLWRLLAMLWQQACEMAGHITSILRKQRSWNRTDARTWPISIALTDLCPCTCQLDPRSKKFHKLPKQCHYQGSKCSDILESGGHFIFKWWIFKCLIIRSQREKFSCNAAALCDDCVRVQLCASRLGSKKRRKGPGSSACPEAHDRMDQNLEHRIKSNSRRYFLRWTLVHFPSHHKA